MHDPIQDVNHLKEKGITAKYSQQGGHAKSTSIRLRTDSLRIRKRF